MVKIQVIEKLFLHILTFSFLLIPLTYLFFRSKRRSDLIIVVYGILFFFLLYLINPDHRYIPKPYLQIYQTFYTFCEYLFFTYLLFQNITINKFKIIILTFTVLFISFLIYDYSINKVNKLDSIPVGIETILIFIYISFFFYQNFKNTNEEYIYIQPCFWVSIGMLIYLGGTFFFNILVNHIDKTQVAKYWFLTYIADIFKNLLFCISIIVSVRSYHKEKLPHKSVPHLDLDMN